MVRDGDGDNGSKEGDVDDLDGLMGDLILGN